MTLRADDIQTLKAVMLYIISHSGSDRRDVYSIVKTAYYAHQMHLARYALPLFKDEIAALPFGPVPSNIYNILKISRGDSAERRYHNNDGLLEIADAICFDAEAFTAREIPDMDYLSASFIECLDAAIAKVGAMNFGEIKNDTHDAEWHRAYYNGTGKHLMDELNIAKEGGASDDALAYLADSLNLAKSFC